MNFKDVKYKGWLKKEHKMVIINYIDFYQNEIKYEDENGFHGITNNETINKDNIFEDIELLRFSGFKDCNNETIYEGDLLEHAGEIGIVKWYDDLAYFAIETHRDGAVHLYNLGAGAGIKVFKDTEIVGNKFENYDLLRDDQMRLLKLEERQVKALESISKSLKELELCVNKPYLDMELKRFRIEKI